MAKQTNLRYAALIFKTTKIEHIWPNNTGIYINDQETKNEFRQ